MAEPLLREAQLFIDGFDVARFVNLQTCLAALKFGSCSERGIEGRRALVSIKAAGRRNRSEA
eukprot:3565911-Pyramimonas_sp.AAC.1